jgi:hypothetical protein
MNSATDLSYKVNYFHFYHKKVKEVKQKSLSQVKFNFVPTEKDRDPYQCKGLDSDQRASDADPQNWFLQ